MWISHAKLLKRSEQILDVGLGVIFGVDVEVSNVVPVAFCTGLSVMRSIVDEILPASGMVVDGKFAFGEMALANKPLYEQLVQVGPVSHGYLQGPVEERSGLDGIVKGHVR